MAWLVLSLLGSFEATLDGEPISGFESAKVQALLAYLAVEADRPHRRDPLAALLWPTRPDGAARNNLRHALASLRETIGDREAAKPFLLVTRETIRFDSTSDHLLDVERFEECVGATGPIGRSAGGQAPTARLEEAVALYRGSFLEGFSLKGCLDFDDWSILVRERLHRLALTAFSRLADYYKYRGEIKQACEAARRLVALESWQEEAHRRLMRLLALSGRRSEALAQYKRCRSTLQEELEVGPERETTALYERIRDGETLYTIDPGPPHNLPAQLFPFVGRVAEVAAIAQRLEDPACRLLTLVGPGGSGKTRLAQEAAAGILSAEQLGSFEDGVFFVSLAPLRSVDGIIPAVVASLGLALRGGGDPRQQTLAYLSRKRLLLILDNFEHLLSSSPPSGGIEGGKKQGESLVLDILQAAADVKILVTSRARLKVQGEVLLQVGGMDMPRTRTVADPLRYSAIQLFVQSAQRGLGHLELKAEDLEHVAHICGLVAGMPLGILLAAGWVPVLSPAEIADEIRKSFDFLETDLTGVPDRQRSMRAVLDHSWRLLTGRQREVFQALSVFRGGFTRQAAQRVTGASLRDLKGLVDRSLVQCTPGGRYEMHELLRQYSGERLDASPASREAAHDQHCAYYVAALEQWERDLKCQRQLAAVAEMDIEIENARAAWEWAAERVQVQPLDRAIEGLCIFYDWRCRWQVMENACEGAVNRLQGVTSPDALRVLARVVSWQGFASGRPGGTGSGMQLLRQALTILERPELAGQDTRKERAFILWDLVCQWPYDPERDRPLAEESLALCRELGDPWRTSWALHWLSWSTSSLNETKLLVEEGLELCEASGDRRTMSYLLLGLARVAREQGHLEEWERVCRRNLANAQDIDELSAVEHALEGLAWALWWSGRFAEAQSLIHEWLPVFEDRLDAIPLWLSLGYVEMSSGQYDEARTQGQKSLAAARRSGNREHLCDSHCLLGRVALAEAESLREAGIAPRAQEAYAEAQRSFEEGIATSREGGQRVFRDWAGLVAAEHGAGDLDQARRHLHEALRQMAQLPRVWQCGPLPAAALLLADAGEHERAVELYALVSRYPYVANSRWFEDVFGRHIDAVAATLPPEVAEAARERGRARDLDATVKELLAELEP